MLRNRKRFEHNDDDDTDVLTESMVFKKRTKFHSTCRPPNDVFTLLFIDKNRKVRWLIFLTSILLVWLIVYLLHHYLFTKYSWVHRRCFLISSNNNNNNNYLNSLWSTRSNIECTEAYYHKQAELESSLWSPILPDDDTILQNRQQAAYHHHDNNDKASSRKPVQHIHYTITAPLTSSNNNHETWDLALCSIRMSAFYLCDGGIDCTINIWIVDKAAPNNDNQTFVVNSIIRDLKKSLTFSSSASSTTTTGKNKKKFAKSCIRIVPEGHYDVQTIDVFSSRDKESTNCIPLNNQTIQLRQWLAYGAHNQLPAHISDAWRLVAMSEIGGLYMDADVLPLSKDNLRYNLPSTTIPSQIKKGKSAYRLNGGLLRMESNSIFLQAMIDDHLFWAPQLEKVPQNNQTFGFLGPAALTRTYLKLLESNDIMTTATSPSTQQHDGDDDNTANNNQVTILPPKLVINQFLCRDTKHAWAVHFTAQKKKKTWKALVQVSCFETLVSQYCASEFYRRNHSIGSGHNPNSQHEHKWKTVTN